MVDELEIRMPNPMLNVSLAPYQKTSRIIQAGYGKGGAQGGGGTEKLEEKNTSTHTDKKRQKRKTSPGQKREKNTKQTAAMHTDFPLAINTYVVYIHVFVCIYIFANVSSFNMF